MYIQTTADFDLAIDQVEQFLAKGINELTTQEKKELTNILKKIDDYKASLAKTISTSPWLG